MLVTCQKYWCVFMVWKMSPVIVVALIAHHTPTLTSRNGTSWINVGNLLWEFMYPISETKGLFPHDALHEDTSSQNSVLLYDLCRRVCELQLSYMGAVTTSACSLTILEWNMLHENFQCICKLLSEFTRHVCINHRASGELCIVSSKWIMTPPDKRRTIEQVREIVQANREEGINDSYQIKLWPSLAHWMQ